MKKPILLLLAIVSFTATLHAQPSARRQQRIAAREEHHRIEGRENNLFLTVASCMTSHNQLVATFKAEYDRQIRGNLFWGVDLAARLHSSNPTTYDWSDRGKSPYRNTVDQNIYKLDGMIFYRLPVIRSRLFFRVGAGVGLGLHRIRNIDDQWNEYTRLLPYFNVEAAWILRITRHFEMKFSPTILLVPSEFSVSPLRLPEPTDVVPWLTDAGFSLTIGWRF